MSSKLRTKDIISIAIYSVIYFFLVALAALFCVFIMPLLFPFISYPYMYIPVIAALFSGIIYMLMVARVQKFGAITLMASIFGIFFLFIFPYAFFVNVIVGLIADLIARSSQYKNKKVVLLSYIVFSFNLHGPSVPMYLFADFYQDVLLNRGRTASQIVNTMSAATLEQGMLLVGLTIVLALIGGYFGQKMLNKHFEKAGII